MRFKRFSAMLLALAMCMGVFSTTVFAYSDESATTTTTGKAETVEKVPEKTGDKTSEEVPYTVTVNEDGTVVFSFNGKEWTYGSEESEDNNMGTGKVVTNGSRLNVRTGAGMNYEIIDQLRPGEEVVVVGVEGDWYQITMPEKNGYVHSDYLELIEKAEQNSEMDMALLMMFMSAFMQIAPLMKMIMNLCKQDRLDAWGSLRVAFTWHLLSRNKIFCVFESDILNIRCGRCAYYYFSHSDWKIYLPHPIEISVILK